MFCFFQDSFDDLVKISICNISNVFLTFDQYNASLQNKSILKSYFWIVVYAMCLKRSYWTLVLPETDVNTTI